MRQLLKLLGVLEFFLYLKSIFYLPAILRLKPKHRLFHQIPSLSFQENFLSCNSNQIFLYAKVAANKTSVPMISMYFIIVHPCFVLEAGLLPVILDLFPGCSHSANKEYFLLLYIGSITCLARFSPHSVWSICCLKSCNARNFK